MANFVSDRRLYVTADKSEVVEEGDEKAAFLLVGEGGVVSEEDANRYGLRLQEHQPKSLLEMEKEGLTAAEERGATDEARTRRARVEAMEAEEAARQQRSATAAPTTKMRATAPANKAAEPPKSPD